MNVINLEDLEEKINLLLLGEGMFQNRHKICDIEVFPNYVYGDNL